MFGPAVVEHEGGMLLLLMAAVGMLVVVWWMEWMMRLREARAAEDAAWAEGELRRAREARGPEILARLRRGDDDRLRERLETMGLN